MRRLCCALALISLVAGVMEGAFAHHTPDHFCEKCVYDNCSAGSFADAMYLDCVSMACGDDCRTLAEGRGNADESCMAQCETVLETCLMASDDSGGVIDDYCAETAQVCYANCRDDSLIGLADGCDDDGP